MLDSPYVRRVAISLQLLDLPFTHQSVSVFDTFEQFRQINPVVKAPSLVCDDGTVLMDSTLIIEYAESLSSPDRSLMPTDLIERQRTLRHIGLALAACEKSIQIVYEHNLRPPEKRHHPWLTRVTGQLLAAYRGLESELMNRPAAMGDKSINQAGITTAVAWHFTQMTLPDVVHPSDFPALQELSAMAEQRREFKAAPYGSSTYHPASEVLS